MWSRSPTASAFLSATLCAVCTAQSPDDRPERADLEPALARAGDARPALEQALDALTGERRASLAFLIRNMPAADFAKEPAARLVQHVELAHDVRAKVAWGEALPDELFRNDVLPYAQANERREDWRPWMVERFLPLVEGCATPGEAARRLNEQIFDLVDVHYSTGRRRADQAPSESIAQHKASCTGLSILLADACRACCVPARLVSVRWPHKPGNHTWVEVWDGENWRFCGADEPDPKGLDRAWFVGDAEKCVDADRAHRVWAVSFGETGERFDAGWGRGVQLWGVDVTARYAPDDWQGDGAWRTGGGEIPTKLPFDLGDPEADDALLAQLARWFEADAARRATFEFDRNLDESLKTKEGDARLRRLVWKALCAHERATLQQDHEARVARAGGKESPFTVEQVGERPADGWGLVIAMHGGGGVPKRINDSQWRHMQVYYHDHPEAGGYLYCALRAPTDEWNGFYTDYFYPVLEKLIRQFVVCDGVDPQKVVAIGYSHGGYGAFAIGPKLPHRFAAVHASAAAPTDGETVPDGLHTLRFSFMVGGRDTAYGRRERCEKFAALLDGLQKAHDGRYPTKFTLVEGNGHGGLPDRDLLADLVSLRRDALPGWLRWKLSDGAVHDHYWLHAKTPQRGPTVVAKRDGQRLELDVEADAPIGLEAWLDARLYDLTKPVVVARGDDEREVTPSPSLRVLCETMAERGDPTLAASWRLRIE